MRHSSLLALGALSLAVGLRPEVASAQASKPNIIVIMTDDQRWDTIGAVHGAASNLPPGLPSVTMPYVTTHLVQQGINFTNAFVTTPLCAPSRASFFTGQYAHTHGVKGNGDSPVFMSSLLPAWLQAQPNGYRTGLFGKYANQYADSVVSFPGPADIPPGWNRWVAYKGQGQFGDQDASPCTLEPAPEPPAGESSPVICEDDPTLGPNKARCDRRGGYSLDLLANKAVDFVDAAAAGEPFFLYFAPKAPHGQGGGNIPRPPTCDNSAFATAGPWGPPSYDTCIVNPPAWQACPASTLDDVQLARREALESLQSVDRAVKRILDKVAQKNLDSSTYVIYTSDNGFFWGEHRRSGKGAPYHEASRVPMVIRPPLGTLAQPREEDRPVLNIDLTATVLDLADKTPGRCAEGRSLEPFLQATAPAPTFPWRESFVIQYWDDAAVPPQVPTYAAFKLPNRKYVEDLPASLPFEREFYRPPDLAFELTNEGQNPTYTATMDNLAARLRSAYPGWPVNEQPSSYIFGSGFECGLTGVGISGTANVETPWTASATGGTLTVEPAAALADTATGLKVVVNAAGAAVHVQDDSPNDENRYHARFYFHPSDFDPGPAVAPRPHGEVYLFLAAEENPVYRLAAVLLQKTSTGTYKIQARARKDDGSWAESPELDITNAQHAVEIDWQRATGAGTNDGEMRVWLDLLGATAPPTAILGALDNDAHAVDFARLGAISAHDSARGTLLFDEFVSRRAHRIGPL